MPATTTSTKCTIAGTTIGLTKVGLRDSHYIRITMGVPSTVHQEDCQCRYSNGEDHEGCRVVLPTHDSTTKINNDEQCTHQITGHRCTLTANMQFYVYPGLLIHSSTFCFVSGLHKY